MRHISGVFQVYSILVRPAYTCKCHHQCPPNFPIPSTQTFSIWKLVCRICSSSNNPILHVKVASWPSLEHLSKCSHSIPNTLPSISALKNPLSPTISHHTNFSGPLPDHAVLAVLCLFLPLSIVDGVHRVIPVPCKGHSGLL